MTPTIPKTIPNDNKCKNGNGIGRKEASLNDEG